MTGRATRSPFAEAAALARIHELGGAMTTQELSESKELARMLWPLGDYHRFATTLIWGLGRELADACGIGPGMRVLDVAAGTGNLAQRAAEAGAEVVASDLSPGQVEVGRRETQARGLDVEWLVADAEALPFPDASFDVVTSCAGAMFAPDQEAVAGELLRVCRPGGTIGMVNFTPEGLAAGFFELFGRYAPPPPPGTRPAVLWGSEPHVRELFGDGVDRLELERRDLVERLPGTPRDYCDFYRENFGPVVGLFAALADEPERAAALDAEFLDVVERANRGGPDGPVELRYEYLLVVARRA